MTQKVELKIDGMTCGSCSKSITARLSKFDFTNNVDVSWEEGKGELEIDGGDEELNQVKEAIETLGFKVLN